MKALFLALFLLTPLGASAQLLGPLVECGNQIVITEGCPAPDGGPGYTVAGECDFCDIVKLAQKLINFFVAFTVVVATLMFVYAGILYMTSASNEGNIKKAHGIFWSVLMGLVFVLAAWLIVDVVMKAFYGNWNDPNVANQGRWGPWNKIICPSDVPQPDRCRPLNVEGEAPITPTTTPPTMSCYEIREPAGGPDPLITRDVRCCFLDAGVCASTLATDQALPGKTLISACTVFPSTAYPLGCPARSPAGLCPRLPAGGYASDNCEECSVELQSTCTREQAVRAALASIGISVNKGFCHPGTPFSDGSFNPGGCTDVGGLSVLGGIAAIMSGCNAMIGGCAGNVVITGGSELGHAGENPQHTECIAAVAHCAGNKVDFRHTAKIDEYVRSSDFTGDTCHGRPGRTHIATGSCWTTDEGDHYDVYFD